MAAEIIVPCCCLRSDMHKFTWKGGLKVPVLFNSRVCVQ